MSIIILGLGPGRLEQLTLEAWRHLEQAQEVYLRTKRHPLVAQLPPSAAYHSFDDLYESAAGFETLYQSIAARILELGQRSQGVTYAVPGHPMVGEHTTQLILQGAKPMGLAVKIIDGLSFIEPSLTALGIDGMSGLQIHDGLDVAELYHPLLNPDQPALIAQVYSREVASAVKLTLMNQYPDDYRVMLLHGAGTTKSQIETVALYEIDRSDHIAHLTTLYIPPMEKASSFEALQNVMAHLRSADGCPWDRKQTHQSLRPHFLEEAHEVLEALDNEDTPALVEELGDVLLHLVFQGQIATDEGEFRFAEVARKIIDKMIRRHPHIWGDLTVNDASHVERNWEAIKKQEQAEKGHTGEKARQSNLDGLPASLPALVQSYRLQERAAGVGFDWQEIGPVIDKVYEEIDEIKDSNDSSEFGDLLFAVVNWARWAGVDPESALREANERFRRRFKYIESHTNGRSLKEVSFEEMDALWDEAKRTGL